MEPVSGILGDYVRSGHLVIAVLACQFKQFPVARDLKLVFLHESDLLLQFLDGLPELLILSLRLPKGSHIVNAFGDGPAGLADPLLHGHENRLKRILDLIDS